MKRPFHLVLVNEEAFVFGGDEAAKAKDLFVKKKNENVDVHLFINPKPKSSWISDAHLRVEKKTTKKTSKKEG